MTKSTTPTVPDRRLVEFIERSQAIEGGRGMRKCRLYNRNSWLYGCR